MHFSLHTPVVVSEHEFDGRIETTDDDWWRVRTRRLLLRKGFSRVRIAPARRPKANIASSPKSFRTPCSSTFRIRDISTGRRTRSKKVSPRARKYFFPRTEEGAHVQASALHVNEGGNGQPLDAVRVVNFVQKSSGFLQRSVLARNVGFRDFGDDFENDVAQSTVPVRFGNVHAKSGSLVTGRVQPYVEDDVDLARQGFKLQLRVFYHEMRVDVDVPFDQRPSPRGAPSSQAPHPFSAVPLLREHVQRHQLFALFLLFFFVRRDVEKCELPRAFPFASLASKRRTGVLAQGCVNFATVVRSKHGSTFTASKSSTAPGYLETWH